MSAPPALNARFPIENPAPEPKQPFSRQNYVGTIGGPIVKDKLWVYSGFEMVNEHASINYSPDSLTAVQRAESTGAGGTDSEHQLRSRCRRMFACPFSLTWA